MTQEIRTTDPHERVPQVAKPSDGPASPPDDTAEAGMATAEYAIATLAAVGFAGLLIVVLKSETVRGLLEGLISTALSAG